jgi:hypothetical protein
MSEFNDIEPRHNQTCGARGESHPKARLTKADVLEIRADPLRHTQKGWAKLKGVSVSAIHLVITRQTWRDVE